MSSIYTKFCTEKFDNEGRLLEMKLDYPENFNFGYDVVDAIAAETPDKRALVWCSPEGEEHILSFGDISRISSKYANAFVSCGIGRGDKVMVALKRHIEYWFVSVALHKIGAVLIPVTHMLTSDDIAYRLNMSRAEAIVCTVQDDFPERVREALTKANTKTTVFSVKEDVEGFINLTKKAEGESGEFSRRETLATDPMLMYFTSGTTGYPKGVVHDFTYPLAHIATAKYWQQAEDGGLHFTISETGWGKASWGKIYGQWLVGSAVMVYDFDNFNPQQLIGVINKYGVTSFCAPATVYRYLVRKEIPAMPTLRYAATAGEMLSPEVFHIFQEKTGLTLREGYGQTETTLLLANFRGYPSKDGALGLPSPFYNIRLMKKDGSEPEVGEIGEIVVVPPKGGKQCGLFTRYLENDGLYSEVWTGEVYHTGDAAWRDEDGYYWFHGRFDDIIKTSGFRVGPYEVENVLMEHPAVMECSVIGVPDKFRGQAIKAFIVTAPGYEPSRKLEREIMEFCNSKMAEYKWVRSIEFKESLPKTISGKIRRIDLRDGKATEE
ncbi:MAG: AMP-binding protein [Firmicutes bacterium]|nr:AMP-binding protein [Bacillota bacterium]